MQFENKGKWQKQISESKQVNEDTMATVRLPMKDWAKIYQNLVTLRMISLTDKLIDQLGLKEIYKYY